MQYRKMPKNDDRLSVLGFGCMRLPQKDGRIDEKRAISQLRYAIDRGVNYIDTAWPYHNGESEPLVGKMLGDGYRYRVKVATKLPSWLVRKREDMDFFLDEQLKRLCTDHIDYYLLHTLNKDLWDRLLNLNVIDFIENALKNGKILHIGFSFHGRLPDFKKIVDDYPWMFCQIQYNYMDTQNQAGTEGLHYAASRNLGVVIMEPLRGGLLGNPEQPETIREILKGSGKQRSPSEWALRWLWDHPEITLLLSGMNEEAHIDENLKTAETAFPNHLTELDRKTVSRISETYRHIMKVGCTGCGYCKPCPSGVDIPECFDVYNNYHISKNMKASVSSYVVRTGGVLRGSKGYASQCIQCGECTEKCPQDIDIPKELERVKEIFETEDLVTVENEVRNYFKL